MKIQKAYNNKILLDALKDRDVTYKSILDDIDSFDLDDEQLQKVKRYQQLTQFEKDLLYLRSCHTVKEIADMYAVSKTIIYNHLKRLNKNL